MSRSCGVVLELTGEVWVGGVGAPMGVGCGSEIGWSVLASGCWPASSTQTYTYGLTWFIIIKPLLLSYITLTK